MMADGVRHHTRSALQRAHYRVRQFGQAARASLRPLQPADEAEARDVLPESAWALYASMPQVDRRHALEVWRTLRAQGHTDPALAQAALLHDCAKHEGGITLAHRVAVVLLKAYRPAFLAGWAAAPAPGPGGWRQAFWAHAHHPETGAALAATAGCDPRAVELIRRHQEPLAQVEPDPWLAALQTADDDN